MLAFGHGRHGVNVKTIQNPRLLQHPGWPQAFQSMWIPFFSFRRWPMAILLIFGAESVGYRLRKCSCVALVCQRKWLIVRVSVSLWEKSCISVRKEVKTNTIYFVGMFLKNIDLNGWRLTEVSDGWSGISLFFAGQHFMWNSDRPRRRQRLRGWIPSYQGRTGYYSMGLT